MLFSTPQFLFAFLPACLICYLLSPNNFKNTVLLCFSLFFYAWGEVVYITLLFFSIISNYLFAISIDASLKIKKKQHAFLYLTFAVSLNLLVLAFFKYSNFIIENLNGLLEMMSLNTLQTTDIHLPLGISFFSFQAISYLLDVYRKQVAAQKNIVQFALYLSLFPQLIAGPIVRYAHLADQLVKRQHSLGLFTEGCRRFILGLAKKVLLANSLAEISDNIFLLSGNELTLPLAWLGLVCYSLQIYYDFSAYSDMAIGLGRMFGFVIPENFNYPYHAKSVKEFWQRWHISLSSWFKDYLYIPLGGSRVTHRKIYRNLFIVFLLTGLWHGASWNFICWGMMHAILILLERMGFDKILRDIPVLFQRLYLLISIMLTWVLFRSSDLGSAFRYYQSLFDISNIYSSQFQIIQVGHPIGWLALILGSYFAFFKPVNIHIFDQNKASPTIKTSLQILSLSGLACLFILSILKVANSTFQPFIYFRF